MNTSRGMICFRNLALILLVLLLTGCLGGQPKVTTTPPAATATASAAGGAAAVSGSGALQANTPEGSAATSYPQPAAGANPTETLAPTEAPSPQAPALTQTPVPTTAAPAAAPVLTGEVYEPIPGCARSRLHWGDIIRIVPEIEYVRIRSTPDTHPADNIVRRLYRSELAQTTDLPVCNYGWIMWPIRTADGTKGWVTESDGVNFWLMKVNGYFPTPTQPSR